ncbi:MAG TPA: hypothetical protein VK399_17785 [Longimicrobiaceae bacterium]|nr:hypothetical protein [Longimicrobiaceae bacterium]
MDAGAALRAFIAHAIASSPEALPEELPSILEDWAEQQGIELPSPAVLSRGGPGARQASGWTTPADVLLPGVPGVQDGPEARLAAEPRLETARLSGMLHPDGTATLAERGGRGAVQLPPDDHVRVARWLLGSPAAAGTALAIAQHVADVHGRRAVLRPLPGGKPAGGGDAEELRRELEDLVGKGALEKEDDLTRGRTGFRPRAE